MARTTNYEKLYKTYQKRRANLYNQGKPMKEQLSLSMFAVTYEAMKIEYQEQGYKTPTKNILQNLTRSEIDYDFTMNQAKALKGYLSKFYEEGLSEDIETFKEQIKMAKTRVERQQIKESFLEEHQGMNISNITQTGKINFNFHIESIRLNTGDYQIKEAIRAYNEELKSQGITNSYDRKKLITQYFFGDSL